MTKIIAKTEWPVIKQRRTDGEHVKRIARDYGVSLATIYNIIKKPDPRPRKSPERVQVVLTPPEPTSPPPSDNRLLETVAAMVFENVPQESLDRLKLNLDDAIASLTKLRAMMFDGVG